MMKRLLNSPPSLPLPPPDKMLNNIFWLRNEQSLVSYIKVGCVHYILRNASLTFNLISVILVNRSTLRSKGYFTSKHTIW